MASDLTDPELDKFLKKIDEIGEIYADMIQN